MSRLPGIGALLGAPWKRAIPPKDAQERAACAILLPPVPANATSLKRRDAVTAAQRPSSGRPRLGPKAARAITRPDGRQVGPDPEGKGVEAAQAR
jgi:hypothetical protein